MFNFPVTAHGYNPLTNTPHTAKIFWRIYQHPSNLLALSDPEHDVTTNLSKRGKLLVQRHGTTSQKAFVFRKFLAQKARKQKVHYHFHNSQLSLVHARKTESPPDPNCLSLHFKIILLSIHRSSRPSLLFRLRFRMLYRGLFLVVDRVQYEKIWGLMCNKKVHQKHVNNSGNECHDLELKQTIK
jgi:hypothetical protein